MQKLRDLYRETQRNANENFDKVTHERMKKIHAFANKQYENSVRNNDLASLDEISFYREKFKTILEVFNDSIQQGYKKSRIQSEIKNILQQNFKPHGEPQQFQDLGQKSQKKSGSSNSQPAPPKDLIQTFFQSKNSEIAKSKVGFKSVLESIPYAPKKFPIKAQENNKPPSPIVVNNTEQIKILQAEIQRLKKQLQQKDVQKNFNMEVLQIEKKQYEQRIHDLCRQVEGLQSQNLRLKEASVKSYPVEPQPYYVPTIYEQERQQEPYNPYHIRYRENDINKIQNKQGKDYQSIKYPPVSAPQSYNHAIKQEQLNDSKLQSQNLQLIKQLEKNVDDSKRKNSEDLLNSSFYKFNKSGVNNDSKAVAIKSKISFFKRSMIIYRGEDYQIAVKSADVVSLQVKKITVYVNNISSNPKSVSLEYRFDAAYYEVKTLRKLAIVEPGSQGKEEVQVKLVKTTDLDSLIQAKMAINGNQVLFLLPAMFLQFIEKRPVFKKTPDYAEQRVVPISQFASLHSTQEYIPLQKLYGDHHESGRTYAVSKNHQGYIYFRWQGGQVQIETIPAWRLFLSYLMLRDY